MRTTVTIDDRLLAEAKSRALQTNRSLGAVIDDALRVAFADRGPDEVKEPFRLPAHGRGGLRPGVDLDDRDSLAELLGDNTRELGESTSSR